MNELIILKETFKKSNEKLRQHPAFLMTLKDIELSITTLKNSTEFIETNFSVKVEKNKKNNSERLELKKYCKFCKKTTAHKETK